MHSAYGCFRHIAECPLVAQKATSLASFALTADRPCWRLFDPPDRIAVATSRTTGSQIGVQQMQRFIDVAGPAGTPNAGSVSPAPPVGRRQSSMFKVLRAVEVVAETIVIVALLAELVLVLANVFDRTYFRRSFLWADEAARLSLSILAFVGGAVAYRRREHAFVRIFHNLVTPPVERVCLVVSDIVVLFVVALTGIASAQFIASAWNELTPVLQLPAALIALPLPLGMVLLALFALDNLSRHSARVTLAPP